MIYVNHIPTCDAIASVFQYRNTLTTQYAQHLETLERAYGFKQPWSAEIQRKVDSALDAIDKIKDRIERVSHFTNRYEQWSNDKTIIVRIFLENGGDNNFTFAMYRRSVDEGSEFVDAERDREIMQGFSKEAFLFNGGIINHGTSDVLDYAIHT
ncbi:hypothetical protein RBG11_004199 [Vibrio parahaemolyticus]|nr:hypothetical protein [Vibrio parahaemolyticus]